MSKQIKLAQQHYGLMLFRWWLKLLCLLAPNFALEKIYQSWVGTRRFPPPSRELHWLQTAHQEHIYVDQRNIAVYRWGKGAKRVLLVHGWNGRGSQLGAFATALANNGYEVIAFDAPGHGLSPGRQTNFYEIVAVLTALHRQYGPFSATIAHSFGVPCVCYAMNQISQFSTALIAISPPASLHHLIQFFTQHLALSPSITAKFIAKINQLFPASLWQDVSAAHQATLLTAPGLIIHDRDDTSVPWQEGEKIAANWPKARLWLTEKLGHQRILREPEVVEGVLRWLEESMLVKNIKSR